MTCREIRDLNIPQALGRICECAFSYEHTTSNLSFFFLHAELNKSETEISHFDVVTTGGVFPHLSSLFSIPHEVASNGALLATSSERNFSLEWSFSLGSSVPFQVLALFRSFIFYKRYTKKNRLSFNILWSKMLFKTVENAFAFVPSSLFSSVPMAAVLGQVCVQAPTVMLISSAWRR